MKMKKNMPNFYKTLLAGASIISLFSGINTATATTRVTNLDTDITNGPGFTPPGFNDEDNLEFGGNHTVIFSKVASPTINIVDFKQFDGILSINSGINIKASEIRSDLAFINNDFVPFGTLNFTGNTTAEINEINKNDYINKIILNNGTVNFVGSANNIQLFPNVFELTNGSILKFSTDNKLKAGSINGINNVSGKDGVGSIVVNTDMQYSGSIGSSKNHIEKITFETDSEFQYTNNDGDFIRALEIYPEAALGTGKGSLMAFYMTKDNNTPKELNNDIGKEDLRLKLLAFSIDPFNEGDPRPQIINLKEGKKIYSDRIDIYPQNKNPQELTQSTLNIEANTLIEGTISVSSLDENNNIVGIVNVLKNTTIKGDIGDNNNSMPEVHFLSLDQNDVISLTGNIYAENMTQISPNLTLKQNSTFAIDTSYQANNATYSLGLNSLNFVASGNIKGNNVVNITADTNNAGKITLSDESENFIMGGKDGVTQMNLNLADLTTTLPPGGEKSYVVFENNARDSTIPDDNLVNFTVISSTNPFVEWVYESRDIEVTVGEAETQILKSGFIVQRTLPQAPIIIINSIPTSDPVTEENLELIANADAGVTNDLVNAIITTDNPQELLDRLLIVITEVTENSFNTVEDLIGDVSANLDQKTGLFATLIAEDSELAGIAAGDTTDRYGAWVSYSLSSNTQEKRGDRPGYKSRSHGVTIGVDTLISDETVVGVALGYIDTKVRHKDSNLGDTSAIKSKLISLYSIKEFLNNWYFQAQAVFGESKVNNRELRGTTANREIAHAKFKSKIYAAAAEITYRHLTKNKVLVSPIVGLEYDVIQKSSYKETGTVNQNLDVRKSPQKKLIGYAGLSLSKNYKLHNYEIVPEVYGVVKHDFKNKELNVISKLDGVADPLITRSAQNVATFYNFGVGITSMVKNSEINIGYDYYVGQKYNSHQGTIKLRLTF